MYYLLAISHKDYKESMERDPYPERGKRVGTPSDNMQLTEPPPGLSETATCSCVRPARTNAGANPEPGEPRGKDHLLENLPTTRWVQHNKYTRRAQYTMYPCP